MPACLNPELFNLFVAFTVIIYIHDFKYLVPFVTVSNLCEDTQNSLLLLIRCQIVGGDFHPLFKATICKSRIPVLFRCLIRQSMSSKQYFQFLRQQLLQKLSLIGKEFLSINSPVSYISA